MFNPANLLQGENGTIIANGMIASVELTVLAWLVAFGVGLGLAVLRAMHTRAGTAFVAVYVAYHRNVPLLVQILFWYVGISGLLPGAMQQWLNGHGGGFFSGAIAIGLCLAAFVSEDLRSGMRSVSSGQREAARSLGLTFFQTMRDIVIPQALRNAMPALVNSTLLIFKNTSLLMAIGVTEMTYASRMIEAQTFRTLEVFLIATAFYLMVSLVIMVGGHALERHYRIAGRRA